MGTATLPPSVLTKKDFQTDQEVRWCPGCGDYAILSAVQAVFPELGIQREKFVVVSGIGCSSRFPYYMNTFGFHTIHGRAPAVATGIKITQSRPGSVGCHGRRRLALDRRQSHHPHAAPQRRRESPALQQQHLRPDEGTVLADFRVRQENEIHAVRLADRPFNPMSLAIGAEATFVARSVDVFQQHLKETLKKAAAHKGSAYVEILQNCNIFNDGAWVDLTEKDARSEHVVQLEHGKPLIFGKNRDKGIRLNGLDLEVVQLGNGITESDLLIHDAAPPAARLRFPARAHGAAPRLPHAHRRAPLLG